MSVKQAELPLTSAYPAVREDRKTGSERELLLVLDRHSSGHRTAGVGAPLLSLASFRGFWAHWVPSDKACGVYYWLRNEKSFRSATVLKPKARPKWTRS